MIIFIKALFLMLQTPPVPGEPPGPPGAPIDKISIYLLLTAIILGYTLIKKKSKIN